MAGDQPFSSNALQIGAAFSQLAASLKEQIAPTTAGIEAAIEGEIQNLYGDKLAQFWQVVDAAEPSELAHIRVGTDDYRVLAYEMGTRPHEIWAHNIALKFEKNGELLYRQMVHHPGTRGKDLAPLLEEAIQAFAEAGWTEALTVIVEQWAADL